MTLTYQMLNPAATATDIASKGGPKIDPTVPQGDIEYDGIEFHYAVADQKISITVVKKPFIYPMSSIVSRLNGYFGIPEV